ncbi:MAG TPA: NUDIX domain-containing protein [Tepidiformaceae bacterium]
MALAAVWRGHELLVQYFGDEVAGEAFWRLPGGGIEFGEFGHDAALREIKEELDADLVDLRHLATIENVFNFRGEDGHEIVFAYEASFLDLALYDMESVQGTESSGETFGLTWKSIPEMRDSGAKFVPPGLLDILEDRLLSRSSRA